MKQRIRVIIGPTASGKSAAAIDEALEENGVIINADSMQVYDALPILTARPTDEEQSIVPHELYAVIDPTEKCTAERWREMATSCIEKALKNGQTPMIVGGTGFYIKSLMEGLAPVPDIPQEIKETARQTQQDMGNPDFHAHLATLDPAMAEQLAPNDSQRLIRAYEVIKATGKSLSEWQKMPHEGCPPDNWEFDIRVIMPERSELHDRINKRLEIMMNMGALDEIKELSARVDKGEIPLDTGVIVAHGFRPFRAYLNDEITYEEAAEKTKAETRQYAKRQTTWIKHQLADYL